MEEKAASSTYNLGIFQAFPLRYAAEVFYTHFLFRHKILKDMPFVIMVEI